MVTAADINKDSNKVAVLTYTGIWLFENFKGENIFNGERYFTELKKRQYEAIAFDRDSLVFTTENGKVFKIKLSTIRNIDKY
jgi:hypothetical protein